MSNVRSSITQALANELPEWSDIRQDEQSVGASVLNVLGNSLEDLHEQSHIIGKNYYLSSGNVDDIDIVYRFDLPKSFEFESNNLDLASPLYTNPTVSGLLTTDQWIEVSIASGNDIESMWYTNKVDRITCSGFEITNAGNDNDGNAIPCCVFSGILAESPVILTASGLDIDYPAGKLWVEVTGGNTYLSSDEENNRNRGSVTITGENSRGIEDVETLIFIHDETQRTIKEWSKVSRVDIQNIEPDTTKVRMFTLRVGRDSNPVIDPPLDAFNFNVSAGSKQQIDTFWDVSNDPVPLLNWIQYVNDNVRDRVAGFVDREIKRSFSLYQTNNTSLIEDCIDLAVQPFSHNIWVLGENHMLYLFDDELTLPSMQLLDKKQSDAMAVVEPSAYHLGYVSGEVEISCSWRRPIIDIIKHRLYVKKPDSSLATLEDTEMAYDASRWIMGNPSNRALRESRIYTLDQRGDWVYTLEVAYRDNTREIDQRIISVDSKSAINQWDLSACVGDVTPIGIDFDSSHNLWYVVQDGSLFKKYRLSLHKDVMMIDYNRKSIFFKEKYEEVKIVT